MKSTIPVLATAIGLALAGPVSAAEDATARALRALDANRAQVRAADADRFHARDVVLDADGAEHVRFERSHGGLPVIGGDFVLHSRDGRLQSTSLTQAQPLRLSLQPRIGAGEAIERAGALADAELAAVPEASLAVYARTAKPRLVWQVRLQGMDAQGIPTDHTWIVDAGDGRLLDQWSNFHTQVSGILTPCTGAAATGTGNSLYGGDVTIGATRCSNGTYHLKDMGRGSAWTVDMNNKTFGGSVFVDADNAWGNHATSDRATAGSDAHYGLARTWDYFKDVHGRNGIANDGKGAKARVHYGLNYVNAAWNESCFCMNFGDGNATYSALVSLDIAGHEMSHGVTSRTARLIYSGESGALNEATSDIFGSMVEFYAANPADAGDYLIGEKIVVAGGGKALRYMFKPSRDGMSLDCWSTAVATKNVHYGSGVANHFYYLLAQGAVAPAGYAYTPAQLVCNGNTALAAIGRAKAEKIWYRALTVYLTSNSNYAAARVATINAAKDLYGATSPEAAAVAAAWSAVSVN